jgi:hypothetical protein
MTQLSRHFGLAEFIQSQTATLRGIDNTPSPTAIQNLMRVAHRREATHHLLAYPRWLVRAFPEQNVMNSQIASAIKRLPDAQRVVMLPGDAVSRAGIGAAHARLTRPDCRRTAAFSSAARTT